MPSQMSHVNKLLAVHKQQQKEGILVLFLTHECTQALELKQLKGGGRESLFCQESIRSFKNKMKNSKRKKSPRLHAS